MNLETSIPNKRLLGFLFKNAEKVEAIGYHGGFCDNAGNSCCKYDVLFADGWHRVDGGGHKCFISGNGNEVIDMIKSLEPCPGKDHDCYGK